MKKLLCKIGFHDWENINLTFVGNKTYRDQVCLRCNKIDDSYTKIGRPLRLERKAQALNILHKNVLWKGGN